MKIVDFWKWLRRPRNLAMVLAIAGGIGYLCDNFLFKSPAVPSSSTHQQNQTTSVLVQLPSPTSVDIAKPAHPAVPDAQQDPVRKDRRVTKDLSGQYVMGVGAPVALSDFEAIEVVEITGFDKNYDVGLRATFWSGNIVHMSPGSSPIDASLDGHLYKVSLSNVELSSATLKLDRRE